MEALAKAIADRVRNGKRAKVRPTLYAVPVPPVSAGLDDLTRASHCKMIRHIRRGWGQPMQQLIDQACFGLAGIEQLPDDALIDLHRDLERAQDCMRDGVTFEDAGLLRSRYG